MKRFLRSGQDSVRERLKRDLFQFNKTVEHGFPHQPSALGFSDSLRLMAIGTRSGAIKLYGSPGVEFMNLHEQNNAVIKVSFVPNQCQLITLLDDNSLHLWSLREQDGVSELQEEKKFTLRGPPGLSTGAPVNLHHDLTSGTSETNRRSSTNCLIQSPPSETQIKVLLAHSSGEWLYVGSEGGSVFTLTLPFLQVLEEKTVGHKMALHGLPDEYASRRLFESVEALQEHPKNPDQILIGYSRGLMMVWDITAGHSVQHFLGTQQVENIFWCQDAQQLVSCHSDGGYSQWETTGKFMQQSPMETKVPYGPFRCKAIRKITWLTSRRGSPYIVFQGGMPMASYGDRHSITVVHGSQQTAFDFTSRIIDHMVICNSNPSADYDDPRALLVLAEEELVAIDLQTSGWPVIQCPYLVSLHCSAITCSYHISSIPLKLWERMISAGRKQNTHYSNMPWPVDGGINLAEAPRQRDLLLTGHEDGTVRFWDASGICLQLMYKLSTVGVFQTDMNQNENLNSQGEEDWPPLRKVGCFDPYSDDPRLGIQKIYLCKYSGYLSVGGTAGQVLVFELNDEVSQHAVDHTLVDLLQEQEGYRWKGHEQLYARRDSVRFPPGFQPSALVQCQPPAAVTSLTLHSEWRLLAFGTSHGFGVYDFQRKCQVMVKCTLHVSDQLALEGPLSRVKSLKKSLRQSFRRIRRSQVNKRRDGVATKVQEANARLQQEALHEMELAPVQRKVEARSAEDSFTGFVRTLYFADTFIRDSIRHCPSLWAGTNGGTVYAFSLRVPPTERRMEEAVSASQIKEIQLMHRAPVVGILILDGHSIPLPEPLEAAHDLSKSPDMQGSHQLIVISEEQFKVFTLPKVSSKLKLKLTATEGCRVRKAAVCMFANCQTEDHSENHLTVLTNLGEIQVVSLPHLKPQVRYDCIRKEDVSGIASCVFTKSGQGFYLISPSEMERFSLSTCWLIAPRCKVNQSEETVNERPWKHDSTKRQNERPRVYSSSDSSTDDMLKEIQRTLEGSQMSHGERKSHQIAIGGRLSNGTE
ncbi:LLGL scribble cell polarity complex component 2 isoform X4 [Hyla sarda]|uniref:LLGL scribble cell polarity complex component 2 isoform X4 n=1 Tax=Hyla sarda TaxID=327740 RepID=UPI0024C3DCE3|nr:LLGL scribble cell polarity complex component 2 isoform X4 [Hyla sarda]